jgi:hypothetical protein
VSPDADTREAALRMAWQDILAHPDDPDRLFLGHAYPRWASFLASSPVEELSEVRWARVMVAQGLADDAVEPFTADVLTASLRVQGIGRDGGSGAARGPLLRPSRDPREGTDGARSWTR